ncbi:MAG: glycyl-radical enzyme activating protein [Phycisphaerae bacterium]|nr:glycyl-radical enzyme activating protein [Phycisphaerae bacterium]
MTSGVVLNIQRYSLQDGPGIRTTVFLKGCPLDCWWCHNPESRSHEQEIIVVENRCMRCGHCREACPTDLAGPCTRCGACVEACPTDARQMAGRTMTTRQVLTEIRKDLVFYEESGGGVSLSGGEPAMQHDFARSVLRACRDEGIHTAIDTSGYAPQEPLLAVAELADLVLYDLKLMDDARHVRYTGVSNATILENLLVLSRRHRTIWIRVPLIPGVNDDATELASIARFAAGVPGVRRLCLLPYHELGMHKSRRLGRPYRMNGTRAPDPEQLDRAARVFQAAGLEVMIGR